MSGQGWLQIVLFLGVVLVLRAAPRRIHGEGLRGSAHLRDGPRPAAGGAVHLQAGRHRPQERDDLEEIRRQHPCVQPRGLPSPLPAAAGPGLVAGRARGNGERTARPRLQHRGQFRDQHQLAGLRRRDHHEVRHPDAGSDGAELRVRRDRDRGGDRPHPRLLPPFHRPAGQLLGRSDPLRALRVAASVLRLRHRAGVSGSRADARDRRRRRNWCSRTRPRTAGRSRRRRSRSVRWHPSSPSSNWAPTAAASSTRTRRTRSRTPRPSPTSCSWWRYS